VIMIGIGVGLVAALKKQGEVLVSSPTWQAPLTGIRWSIRGTLNSRTTWSAGVALVSLSSAATLS